MTEADGTRRPGATLPGDNHVHTEWSWDASSGAMRLACEEAIRIGLPSIAFTDHADFTAWALPGTAKDSATVRVIDTHARSGLLDDEGYWACLEECRDRFPSLRILAGVEAGEPHLFSTEIGALLRKRAYQRVLGSLHSLRVDGVLHYVPELLTADSAQDVMRDYFAETLRMVEGSDVFEILAHVDYPMRAWPKDARPYEATDFEDEYRAVLRALAQSGRVLEVNTQGPWPAPEVLAWWREEGGAAVSFGSDAHEPWTVGRSFPDAVAMVESAGFRPGSDPADFWRR
ncbi:MAG: PHP domain-containing protein [Micromonosporaceae bacterium]